MREIKFRAWLKSMDELNRMYEVKSLHLSTGNIIISTRYGNRSIKSFQYDLMQYTGLKDKNGVEIYEGDIVICYPEDIVNSYTKVVKWASDRPTLGITVDSSGLTLCESSTKYIEVIGNIYENPELWEQDNG